MTPPRSKYGPLHALAAGAVLVLPPFLSGFAAFWHRFLHGSNIQLTEKDLLPLLGYNALFFGGLFLLLWLSTLFPGHDKRNPPAGGSGVSPLHHPLGEAASRRFTITLTLLSAIPICLIASGLNYASNELLRLVGIELSDQDLVKVVMGNALSPRNKAILFSFLLLEAPLFEELLFRGVVFGGCAKVMPVWVAMLLSGFLFAFIHVNAATLIPLWFLGISFAWLYVRTGTLLAPMAVHLIFNATNLLMLLFTKSS